MPRSEQVGGLAKLCRGELCQQARDHSGESCRVKVRVHCHAFSNYGVSPLAEFASPNNAVGGRDHVIALE